MAWDQQYIKFLHKLLASQIGMEKFKAYLKLELVPQLNKCSGIKFYPNFETLLVLAKIFYSIVP